ncbi:unnamed protein product, partial [Phaeothamnion confervicola]
MLNCYAPRMARATAAPKGDAASSNGAAAAAEERADGRGQYDLRRVFLELGVVGGATGSAYVEFEHTKIVCAVYGPRAETRGGVAFTEEGQLRCDVKYAPFATAGAGRSDARGPTDRERELSAQLRDTLQASIQLARLTKSVLDVYCIVLQSDGGEMAAATTCASLALADAGIELFDLVTACSVACVGPTVRMDPTAEEEATCDGVMMVAVMPSSQEVTQWWQRGNLERRVVAAAIELC